LEWEEKSFFNAFHCEPEAPENQGTAGGHADLDFFASGSFFRLRASKTHQNGFGGVPGKLGGLLIT